jgi:hypothetical protein
MSLLATAKANGIEPHAWLTDTLTRLPTTTGPRHRLHVAAGIAFDHLQGEAGGRLLRFSVSVCST